MIAPAGAPLRGRTLPLSVAPMMDCTDRHFRWFMRLISRRTLLYTEMIPVAAALQGDRERLLGFSPEERPLALQLGGDDPAQLAEAAAIAEDLGYDEVNLNVGCPSPRVQTGNFGAALMADPPRVAAIVAAMRARVRVPVTVKHRIGIDERDSYEDLRGFVETVAAAGCDRFSVHARKACLNGLSPRENRTIPPLRYEDVYRLKRELPHLPVELNGGVDALEQVPGHLARVDAVMIGRLAYRDPYALAGADRLLFGEQAAPLTREQVAEAMIPYLERMEARGARPQQVLRHMQSLFLGQPGAGRWRRFLAEHQSGPGGAEVLRQALAARQGARARPERSRPGGALPAGVPVSP